MSLGRSLRSVANWFLRPLRWEVVKYRGGPLAALTMEGGLARARQHGIRVASVIDIGASDGKWARLALKHFPESRVLAFEPLAERQAALEQQKSREPRFDFLPCVAGDREGEVAFQVAPDLDGSGVCSEGSPDARMVPMKTIDAAVRERGLEGPYCLKFDTHGFELPILAGAASTLAHTNLLIMEVYNFQLHEQSLRFHEMCRHLESLGFRSFDLVDLLLRKKDRALWQADMFFAREDHPLFSYSAYV